MMAFLVVVVLLVLRLGSVRACNPQSESTFALVVNGQPETITVADMSCSGQTPDSMNFSSPGNANVTMETGFAWTIFRLTLQENYTVNTYSIQASCGCNQQVCGEDCQTGEACTFYHPSNWFTCRFGGDYSWCWTVVSSSSQVWRSFSLILDNIIATSTYWGIPLPATSAASNATNVISTNAATAGAINTLSLQGGNLNYTYTGSIASYTAGMFDDLANMRFAESEYALMAVDGMAHLNDMPSYTPNYAASDCGSAQLNVSTDTQTNIALKETGFTVYTVIRSAPAGGLTSLNGYTYLSDTGLVPVNAGDTGFRFLDPCNQVFIDVTLQNGSYFVTTTPQTVNKGSFCILVLNKKNGPEDLLLYEFSDEADEFTPSVAFLGLISPDYITSIDVRLVSDYTPTFSVASYQINFYVGPPQGAAAVDASAVYLYAAFGQANAVCTIVLSPNCSLWHNFSTTSEQLDVSSCMPLNAIGTYSCDGQYGTFPINANYSLQIPTAIYSSGTLISSAYSNGESYSMAWPGFWANLGNCFDAFFDFMGDWSWEGCVEKIIIVAVIGYIAFKIYINFTPTGQYMKLATSVR